LTAAVPVQVRTVARLAACCRVDLALTKLALQSLLAARWIQLLDPFAFSNAYAATRRLQVRAPSASPPPVSPPQ
jgi:hypothetical protein